MAPRPKPNDEVIVLSSEIEVGDHNMMPPTIFPRLSPTGIKLNPF